MSFTTTVGGGDYTITNGCGRLTCLRHGEVWEAGDNALVGDKLALAIMHRIEEDGKEIKRLERALEDAGERAASLERVIRHLRDGDSVVEESR